MKGRRGGKGKGEILLWPWISCIIDQSWDEDGRRAAGGQTKEVFEAGRNHPPNTGIYRLLQPVTRASFWAALSQAGGLDQCPATTEASFGISGLDRRVYARGVVSSFDVNSNLKIKKRAQSLDGGVAWPGQLRHHRGARRGCKRLTGRGDTKVVHWSLKWTFASEISTIRALTFCVSCWACSASPHRYFPHASQAGSQSGISADEALPLPR